MNFFSPNIRRRFLFSLTLNALLIFRYHTLASKGWRARYWYAINSLGYRDIKHPEAEFRGRTATLG